MRIGSVVINLCKFVLPVCWMSKLEIAQAVVACCLIIVEFYTAAVYDTQTKADFTCDFQVGCRYHGYNDSNVVT